MTDYCSNRIHGSTTTSSLNDISLPLLSSSSSSSLLINNKKNNHLSSRIVRMLRPNNSKKLFYGAKTDNYYSAFGFSIRGGKEFDVGFFVSKIDKDSEADLKGLKIGDQIIKINGYKVDDATHREITQFISTQDRLILNVRGTDMIPVKEKSTDPLNWHVMSKIISQTNLEENNDTLLSRSQNDVRRIVIKIFPRMKLGLGICKGPEWKPGIFVQFTKEYSVAKNYGLQCGDQILSCNNIDFSNNNILFSEAVNIMKNSQILELIIRQGAGIDLFPGESSGYNSSASSITGDQSPCYWKNQQRRQWNQQSQTLKRINNDNMQQKQENHNQKLHKFENDSNNLNLLNQNKNFNYENCQTVNNRNDKNSTSKHNNENNKTIIQLSENGTLINNTLIPHVVNENSYQLSLSSSSSSPSKEENNVQFTGNRYNASTTGILNEINDDKIDDICRVLHPNETKSRTVTVEVHRSTVTNKKETINSLSSSPSKPQYTIPVSPPEPPPYFTSISTLQSLVAQESNNDRRNFQDSFNSREPISCCATKTMITSTNSSLSNAINNELKKRQERKLCCQKLNQPSTEKSSENEIKRTKQPKQFSNPSVTSYNNNSNENMHNALMDEFKRVHRKMFKNGLQDSETNDV